MTQKAQKVGWLMDVDGRTVDEVIEYFKKVKEEVGGDCVVGFDHYGDEGYKSSIDKI